MKLSTRLVGSILLLSVCTHAQTESYYSQWFESVFFQTDHTSIGPDNGGLPAVYSIIGPIEETGKEEFRSYVADFDFLTSSLNESGNVNISVLVHNKKDLESLMSEKPVNAQISRDHEGTEQLRKYELRTKTSFVMSNTIPGFPCLRNLQGVFNTMDELVEKAQSIESLVVEVVDIGDSYLKSVNSTEGYDIKALKITGNGVAGRGESTEKGILFVTTGMHAREYVPPELGSRFAEALVNGYGIDADITSVLDHTEVHLILEGNPDGRFVAETQPALYQRKNQRTTCDNPDGQEGVDLVRNFPFKWGLDTGSSSDPCSQVYRGSGPASEPEVQAIIEYAKTVFPADQRKEDPIGQINEPFDENTRGVYLDIHSYSELIIWPWSFENLESANDAGEEALARKIKSFNDYKLSGPQQADFLYTASGVTSDWFFGELGAASFVYELGTAFYQDCATVENEVIPGNLPSLIHAAKSSLKPLSLAKGPDITALLMMEKVSYHPTTSFEITAEISDSALSAGPPGYPTSTQSISTISLTVDMHPDDKDGDGNGPNVVQFAVDSNSGTVTKTISIPVSLVEALFRKSTIGHHTIYVFGTDSDGYDGIVTAASFEPLCLREHEQCKLCIDWRGRLCGH